jgi:hypothetical protein
MGVFERAPESITGGTVRKTLSWIGGGGFVDPVPGGDMRRAISATTTGSDYSWDSESEQESRLDSIAGEDVGEGVRLLDDEIVKSPTDI